MRFHTSFSLPKVVRPNDVFVHGPVRLPVRQRGFKAWMRRDDAPGLPLVVLTPEAERRTLIRTLG
jgi:hypothetical protein